MNTLKSNYEKHMKSMYGVKEVGVPEVDRMELSNLVVPLRNRVQPWLLGYAMQQVLASCPEAQSGLYSWHGRLINLPAESSGLISRVPEREIIPLVQGVVRYLQLEKVVQIETEGNLDVDNLKKVLKTARWWERKLK